MNIFVVGTGRCGTVTFSKAAAHCTNYSVGHETKAGRVADWHYPDNHIEVSSQLVIAIPLLRKRYPDAQWIHLVREREACSRSLARMTHVMRAFSWVWFQQPAPSLPAAGEVVYDLVNGLCEDMLGESWDYYRLQLERVHDDWRVCWDFMECEGDYEKSLAEWNTRHNAYRPRKESST